MHLHHISIVLISERPASSGCAHQQNPVGFQHNNLPDREGIPILPNRCMKCCNGRSRIQDLRLHYPRMDKEESASGVASYRVRITQDGVKAIDILKKELV